MTVDSFDGIICFGGADWWYHNHGHYDIQMCRQFSKQIPVLYVNSIGVRTPSLSEGGMFFRRIIRKTRSWARGFHEVDEGFAVLSPITVPGRMGRVVSHRVMLAQIRRAAKRMGIQRPLIWVETPTAAPLLDDLEHVCVIYQRTDRYEEFPGVDRAEITSCDRKLKESAVATLFCSTALFESEQDECRANFVDHGVHFDRFESAGRSETIPGDMLDLSRPIVGFVGGIDASTFDGALFLSVASALPEVTFVLVGDSSLPEKWCTEENVVFLGQKDYESVPEYMAACDVLIMPWRQNDWIRACNPVKLKEYLAVGRPVVTTPFDELSRYEGLVSVAVGEQDFTRAVARAIDDAESLWDPTSGQDRVRNETWEAKAFAVAENLRSDGFEMRTPAVPKSWL